MNSEKDTKNTNINYKNKKRTSRRETIKKEENTFATCPSFATDLIQVNNFDLTYSYNYI